MEDKRKNNSEKQISIPLFIPVLIIIVSVIVFINVSNLNSTVIASTNQGKEETNPQNEIETENVVEIEEQLTTPTTEEVVEEVEEVVEEEPVTNTETQNATPQTATCTVNGKEYTVVGSINIPSLQIEYPILSETTTQLLKVSVTKYWGANPNEVGNMVVMGHNYKNNRFFGNLSKIKNGDIVKITDLAGKTLDYEVYDTYIIDPYDNACTSQLTDGKKEITLITCHYENGSSHATKRFVVKARAN